MALVMRLATKTEPSGLVISVGGKKQDGNLCLYGMGGACLLDK